MTSALLVDYISSKAARQVSVTGQPTHPAPAPGDSDTDDDRSRPRCLGSTRLTVLTVVHRRRRTAASGRDLYSTTAANGAALLYFGVLMTLPYR